VYGYALRPNLDPTRRDPYGQPERIGTKLEIDAQQAAIVRENYRRYADGVSCRTIAKDLNSQGVPSAGSMWKRKVRRCSGWMGSAESCPSRIFLPSPQALEPQLRTVYESFGLNARQIELIAHATPKQDYYYQSPLGHRLVDLGLGPVALAFVGASRQEDQRYAPGIGRGARTRKGWNVFGRRDLSGS
jgi:hypothetical protein